MTAVGEGLPAPRWERVAAAFLPSGLGLAAFAVAFARVQHLAVEHGQVGWRSWLIASTTEAMALAAVLEIRARRRLGAGSGAPVIVLAAGLGMSLAANIADRGPGTWGLVMAAWPVIAFAAVMLLKATRPSRAVPGYEAAEAEEPPRRPAPAVAEPPSVSMGLAHGLTAKATCNGRSTVSPDGVWQSKKAHLLALVAQVPADDPRTNGELARDLAPAIPLHEGTARRYIGTARRSLQSTTERR